MRFFAVLMALCFLPANHGVAQEQAKKPAVKISHFSGKPVPRFESLKYPAVHGRLGPSLDQPIVWKYERKGLPVLILKESQDWRFIRDPDGDKVWVHSRMLSSARTALVRSRVEMHKKAGEEAETIAILEDGVVADLESCSSTWCEVVAERYRGYVPRQNLWGCSADEEEL